MKNYNDISDDEIKTDEGEIILRKKLNKYRDDYANLDESIFIPSLNLNLFISKFNFLEFKELKKENETNKALVTLFLLHNQSFFTVDALRHIKAKGK